MNEPSQDLDPLGALVDEFLDRRARGERPTVDEYAEAHPQYADRIRAFFPALLAVEELKPNSDDATGSLGRGPRSGQGLLLDRLGDFRIIREIGRGGMGVVYEAEQESLSRRVAVKVLGSPALLDPRRLARFQREAKAAARLHHTNIVPVFGVGELDGVHYYVMQYITGAGLDEVLNDVRRLQGTRADAASGPENPSVSAAHALLHDRSPWPAPADAAARRSDAAGDSSDASVRSSTQSLHSVASETGPSYARSIARIGVHVAEALEYAHEQGILHRDIKPSNILLDVHGTPWVTDFGLAKATADSDLTHTGDIVGTIRYMAPERFHGRCNGLSDVYALGLTLYELLARVPAFEGADRNQLIRQVHQVEPVRLRKCDPSIPRDLETIVHKAIEKEPIHRYASAVALADDLRRFLDDQPIQARRASLSERTRRWSRRNRLTAGLAAVAVVSLLSAALVGWTGYVITTRALRSEQKRRNEAEVATRDARAATLRAEENVSLSLEVFEELFNKLTANDERLLPPAPGLPRDPAKGGDGPPPGGPPLGGPPPGSFDRPPHPPGRDDGETELLESMLRFYDRFADRNATNPRLRGEVAWAYRKVGALYAELERAEEADAAYVRAIQMFEELIAQLPNVPEYRAKLVETSIMADPWTTPAAALGRLENRLGRARELIDQLSEDSPENRSYLQAQVHVYAKLGAVLQRLGRDSEADASYRRAIDVASRLIALAPSSPRARLDRAFCREALAFLEIRLGRTDEARRRLNDALADLGSLPLGGSRFGITPETFETLAEGFARLGEADRAEELRRAAAEVRGRVRDFPRPFGRRPQPMRRPHRPLLGVGREGEF